MFQEYSFYDLADGGTNFANFISSNRIFRCSLYFSESEACLMGSSMSC